LARAVDRIFPRMNAITSREILTTPETQRLVLAGAPVAIGISGGKDSTALAISLNAYLDQVGHPREKRVLIHSHLGGIEWQHSLPWCEKLAAFLDLPLLVVSRPSGGLIERWESRWAANLDRYLNLECLKLILPWSTASMRFCTSELKTDIICRALRKRFPNESILSASGIRSEESSSRRKAPVVKPQAKLSRVRDNIQGWDWAPIKEFTLQDVHDVHAESGFPLHPAYTEFGASRVSCALCIFSSLDDQFAALNDPHNHETYARLCALELASTFSFQGTRWLCDLNPALRESLLPGSSDRLARAKELSAQRVALEATLPKELCFSAGTTWTPRPITLAEATLIHGVRAAIMGGLGVSRGDETPDSIQAMLNARVFAGAPFDDSDLVQDSLQLAAA